MSEWHHLGEPVGEVQAVHIGDHKIVIRTDSETKRYNREHFNLGIMMHELPPSVEVDE